MGHMLVNQQHNNPFVVSTDIINQMDSYDNPIFVMVDKFLYVTVLSMNFIESGWVVGDTLHEELGALHTQYIIN